MPCGPFGRNRDSHSAIQYPPLCPLLTRVKTGDSPPPDAASGCSCAACWQASAKKQ